MNLSLGTAPSRHGWGRPRWGWSRGPSRRYLRCFAVLWQSGGTARSTDAYRQV